MNTLSAQAALADAASTLVTLLQLREIFKEELNHLMGMAGVECPPRAEILANAIFDLIRQAQSSVWEAGARVNQLSDEVKTNGGL